MNAKVKVCGLRRIEDTEYANKVKPDFIGFVFAESKRQITEQQALMLARNLDDSIKKVGVFVDQPGDMIVRLLEDKVIDLVQLHGKEDNDYIHRLCDMANIKKDCIIKAVRVKSAEDIKLAESYDCGYLLLDAYSDKAAGGSGETFDWTMIKNVTKPFFLAGGISAENVETAIKCVHPFAVDASSSMETDGFKDYDKMAQFVSKVRACGF